MKVVKSKITPLTPINGDEILLQIQRVAKTCYKTYSDKDDIESAKRIVKQLMTSGHHSMFEFPTITMNYVSNIAAYKDLTRHRHCTFAIESTRYCDYSKDRMGNNVKFLDPVEITDSQQYAIWVQTMQKLEDAYIKMAKLGAKPDQLSLILPQSTAAEFNMTANLREWRHVLALRAVGTTGKSRPCVQEIMKPTLTLFHNKIPVLFDDLYEQMKQKGG